MRVPSVSFAWRRLHADEAIAAVDAEEAALAGAQHRVRQDEAIYTRAERDRIRYQGILESGVVSRSEYDAREAEAIADAQILESDRATVIAEQHKIAQARSIVAQRQAQVAAARTAPQQVSDAQARSESSIGQVGQAKADLHSADSAAGICPGWNALAAISTVAASAFSRSNSV